MPTYTNVAYRAGYQTYIGLAAQTSRLVSVDATADPTPPAPTDSLGLCEPPGWDITENMQPVQSIGAMRDISYVPGRRECVIRTNILVSDFSLFANAATTPSYIAIRNHSDPDATGLVNGLQLCTVELGAAPAFGSPYPVAGVDSLLQMLQITYGEGRPVTASVEFWPVAIIELAAANVTQHEIPTGNAAQPLIWQYLQWSIGGTDYKPILSGVTIAITNNLIRQGSRPVLLDGDTGEELAISRTAYNILPGMEQVRVTYTLRDRLPAELQTTSDWGQVTLHAEQPGTGAGRCYLTITIDHHHLQRTGMRQTQAGAEVQFSADVAAYAISIDAGVTTA